MWPQGKVGSPHTEHVGISRTTVLCQLHASESCKQMSDAASTPHQTPTACRTGRIEKLTHGKMLVSWYEKKDGGKAPDGVFPMRMCTMRFDLGATCCGRTSDSSVRLVCMRAPGLMAACTRWTSGLCEQHAASATLTSGHSAPGRPLTYVQASHSMRASSVLAFRSRRSPGL